MVISKRKRREIAPIIMLSKHIKGLSNSRQAFFYCLIVNYLGASPRGIERKIILASRQASEHLNLDYRVK